MIITPQNYVRGRAKFCHVLGDGTRAQIMPWQNNLVMYEWATSIVKLLSQGLANYRLSGMYLEYKNVADPGDAIAVPSYGRADGVSYYDALADSPDVDYLRVPLLASTVGSSDTELFPGGNVLTCFAQSQGVIGVHGKAFSDSVNSKIYGGALVAIVDEDDATRDIIFSRFYTSESQQVVKLPTSNLGLEWELTFG
jgi:hypothetical protein